MQLQLQLDLIPLMFGAFAYLVWTFCLKAFRPKQCSKSEKLCPEFEKCCEANPVETEPEPESEDTCSSEGCQQTCNLGKLGGWTILVCLCLYFVATQSTINESRDSVPTFATPEQTETESDFQTEIDTPEVNVETQTFRMSDPDGDEGLYTGPVDGEGRAHGLGELKYDEGVVFIGEFKEGAMFKGVAYSRGLAQFTMAEGAWTDELNYETVAQFPKASEIETRSQPVTIQAEQELDPFFPSESDGGLFTVPLTRQRVPISTEGGTIHYKSAYYGTVFAGTPRVGYKVVFDTGSGHLILPSTYCSSETCRAHRRYRRSQSSSARDIDHDGTTVQAGEPRDQITVSFGTGEVTGVFVEDTVCVDHDLEQTALASSSSTDELPPGCMKMAMIVATDMSAEPFKAFEFDGVLGLGLDGLSQGPTFNFIDVVAGALERQDSSMPHTFGVYLAEDGHGTSEITLGGWSQERLEEKLRWNPVLDPELGHWTVAIKHMHVDGEPVSFCENGGCKAVVDTGTSLLAVPTNAFAELYEMLRHSAPPGGNCKGVGPQLHMVLESFTVQLGPEDYSRFEEGQVKPSAMFNPNNPPAKPANRCRPMLMTMDLPEPLGPKLFILGEPVLRKYYTVYDGKGKRVGFGRAKSKPPGNITDGDVRSIA